jgi:hypothetical protein
MDMPEDHLKEVWLAIKRLTFREGMTPEKIGQDLIETLGISTPQEGYDLIRKALGRLPRGRCTEAVQHGLCGAGYSPLVTTRYAILARQHQVTDTTIRAWSVKGARLLARELLNPTPPPSLPPQPKIEPVDTTTAPEIRQLLEEQIALLREIRDLLSGK